MKHKLPRILISFSQKLVQKMYRKIEISNYLEKCNAILADHAVSIIELKDGFFPFG